MNNSCTTSPAPLRTIPLPRAPQTASPVPWLTSIHGTVRRGPYGDPRYRGNCSGYLIKDLLRYFGATHVLDPMTGSGTCKDVCQELGVYCHSFDVKAGVDAAEAASYQDIGPFNFAWLHPPYWRQIRYSDDPRCLSNAPSLRAFLERMRAVIRNCRDVLTPKGKIAILMGDYCDRGRRQIPLTHLTMHVAMSEGLWPTCTNIIRLQYGNRSSAKTYNSSFIPGLHDVCMVLERDSHRG